MNTDNLSSSSLTASSNNIRSKSIFGVLFRKPFTFQKITLLVATIVFVVCIILLSYTFYELNQSRLFPPKIAECPDYFEVTGKNKCKNFKNMGKCGDSEFDFDDEKYKGYNGMKEKLKWANDCGVVWDGITNNAELYK